MSDDLVTWLREAASRHNNYRCDEAADRIDELKAHCLRQEALLLEIIALCRIALERGKNDGYSSY